MTQINRNQPRVAMIQDGARLRYTVPLAMQRAGILERVFIDWFVREGSLEEKIAGIGKKFRPQLGRKMAERTSPELDASRVLRNPAMALRLKLRMNKFAKSEDAYIWASRETAKWIIRKGFGQANILHGFIRNAAPEAYRAAKAAGLRTSGDQIIAPLEVEMAEMKRQVQRWPGWSAREGIDLHQEYLDFERQTWESLDGITCASDYVREGLISVGVAAERITVAPYPWQGPEGPPIERTKKSGPLLIGFVGAVGLRKARLGFWKRPSGSILRRSGSRWLVPSCWITRGSNHSAIVSNSLAQCLIAKSLIGCGNSTSFSSPRPAKAPPALYSKRWAAQSRSSQRPTAARVCATAPRDLFAPTTISAASSRPSDGSTTTVICS